MAAGTNQTLKAGLAIIGLVGACTFTFLRVFGDSESGQPTAKLVEEDRRAPAEIPPQEKKSKGSAATEGKTLNPLSWDEYLRYDPFEGRGRPSEAILALAMSPSPFFAETIAVASAGGNEPSNPANQFALSAILGSAQARVAVVDNRPYRTGDFLLAKGGERLQDAEYGFLRVARIESDRIEIEAAGFRFTLLLPAVEQELVRWAEKNKTGTGEAKNH